MHCVQVGSIDITTTGKLILHKLFAITIESTVQKPKASRASESVERHYSTSRHEIIT